MESYNAAPPTDARGYVARVRSSVPGALLELPVWLLWKSVRADRKRKPRKVPYCADGRPREGDLDSPADRSRLVTFDEAAEVYLANHGYAGLGVALGDVPGEEIHLSGIDLDDVALDDPRVLEIMAAADSYAEISPSGNGIKIFGTGTIGTADVQTEKGGLEIYQGQRFFTVTGQRVNGAHVADLTDAASVARRLWAVQKAASKQKPEPRSSSTAATPWGRLNDLALEKIMLWAPALFPSGQAYAKGRSWRVPAADYGFPDCEEDLSIHPEGVRLYGPDTTCSPLDLVARYLGREGTAQREKPLPPLEAARWLAARLEVDLGKLGFENVPTATVFSPESIRTENAKPGPPLPHVFDPAVARVPADVFADPPAAPTFVVERILPADVGVRAAAGGTAKTTLELLEAVHLILGRPLYGFEVLRPGPVLIVTAEDEKERLLWRLVQIANALQLSDEDKAKVAAGLYLEDLSDQPRRLVDTLLQSQSLHITPVVHEIAEKYADVRPVLTVFDPQTYFGPGERYVNDGEALLMSAGRVLCKAWGGAVRFDHHVGKMQFRDGKVDMYAGRGGSAGADNARFVHVVVPHERDDGTYKAPVSVAPEDIAERRLLRLHVEKVSHGPPVRDPIWLLRKGWAFERVRPTQLDPEVIQRDRLRELWHFLRKQNETGIRHTKTSLEECYGQLAMKRNEVRVLIHVGIEKRHLVEIEIEKGKRKGKLTHYLTTGSQP